jgi:uncharacterized membrane protein
MLSQIAHMLIKRWYVFSFLFAYLGLASYHWGWKRTLKFLIFGYLIAWVSEASSIRNGFPYGFYSYHYEAMEGEFFLLGVPLWDSLSYTFLSFAGWMMALYLRSRWNRFAPLPTLQRSCLTILLGAFLTMVLDIVIDPVANKGSQWFLGEIYSYPHGGLYFGVPLSNFFGWFLVALAILSAFRLTDKLEGIPKSIHSVQLGMLFYLSIYFFNLGIAHYIKAYPLAFASAGWGACLWLLARMGSKRNLEEIT